MILLDENILASQRELLRSWRIAVRQIGYDFAEKGLQDEQIISLLHRQRNITFVTRDLGLYDEQLRHTRYSLVCLAVSKAEVASFVKRVLRHPELNTRAKRMGTVVRVAHVGLRVWRIGSKEESQLDWPE